MKNEDNIETLDLDINSTDVNPVIINNVSETNNFTEELNEVTPVVKKKKNKPVMILILVLVFLIIAGGGLYIYFTFFANNKSTTFIDDRDSLLVDIVSKFNEGSLIERLKENGTIDASVYRNEIKVKYTLADEEILYCNMIKQEDLLITTTSNEILPDDNYCSEVYAYIYDAVFVINGYEEKMYVNLMNSETDISKYSFIDIEVDDNNTVVSFDLTGNYDVEIEEVEYILPEDISSNVNVDDILGSEDDYVIVKKDNIFMYIMYSPDKIEVYFSEISGSSNLTYNSILSFVETIYPDDFDDFSEKFTNFEGVTIGNIRVATELRDSYIDSLIEDDKVMEDADLFTVLIIDK